MASENINEVRWHVVPRFVLEKLHNFYVFVHILLKFLRNMYFLK